MRAAARYTNPVLAVMGGVLVIFVARGFFAGNSPADVPVIVAAEKRLASAPQAARYNDLALAYYNAGRMAESASAASKAISIDPNVALYYNNLCAAYNSLGDYDAALQACESALKLDANLTIAANNRNWALNHRTKR